MAKMEYTVDKTNTISKVKTAVKEAIMTEFFEYLTEKYGEENVGWVRTGGQSKTNEIAVNYADAVVDGEVLPICFKMNATVPEFVTRDTQKRSYVAFDFNAARAEYDDWVLEKAEKAAEAASKKAAKIEKDKAKREEKDIEF